MKNASLILPAVSPGCFALTNEQAAQLFTPAEIEVGESRLEVKSIGGNYSIPVSAFGLVVSFDYDANTYSNPQPLLCYGKRAMSAWKQTGFEAEGKVSLNGKKRRVFTSSKLFQLPNGKLLSAGVLHLGNE